MTPAITAEIHTLHATELKEERHGFTQRKSLNLVVYQMICIKCIKEDKFWYQVKTNRNKANGSCQYVIDGNNQTLVMYSRQGRLSLASTCCELVCLG